MEVRETQDLENTEELSRRERERLMRRQLMLDAARAVFAEKGYADATLDEIAQRAEFGKGTLYNYFEGGKEEILFAIFDDLHEELHRVIDRSFNPSLVQQQSFRDVFVGFLTEIFRFFIERHDQFMIMMKEGHRMVFNEAPETAAYFMQKNEAIVKALIPSIEAAAKKGELRNFPPHSVAHMIMGNIKGYHMHMCMAECMPRIDPKTSRESKTEDLPKPAIGGSDRPPTPAAGDSDWSMPPPEQSAQFLSTFLLDGMLEQK